VPCHTYLKSMTTVEAPDGMQHIFHNDNIKPDKFTRGLWLGHGA